MPSTNQPNRSRGAVALTRARLRASKGARGARISAWAAFAIFAVAALVLRASDGENAALAGLVVAAAHWIVWVAAAPLALAAADDPRATDRREGIVLLAAARGISTAGLATARVLAAMIEITRILALPLVLLSILTAALAGRFAAAIDRLALGLGALVFSIVAGVTLGGVAAACARISGPRGRWILIAVVILPWLLADLAGHGAWSIPGALGAVLDFALRVRS